MLRLTIFVPIAVLPALLVYPNHHAIFNTAIEDLHFSHFKFTITADIIDFTQAASFKYNYN